MAQARHQTEEGVSDTVVAPATPTGRSALAVVRVSGPRTREIARALLGDAELEPRRATTRLARRRGSVVDRVVAVLWQGDDSPIGEDLLEISSHGSPEIVRELVAAAVEAGARAAEPGEFTRRAFTNGKIDLAQAEAVRALIAARGERARSAALDRLEGGASRLVRDARTPILELLTLLEARLDHPDEDIPPLGDAHAQAALLALRTPLERMLAAHDRGRCEREGLRVCLVGRPNAGKSSLLNALLGRERAIVAAAAGTTRDTIEEQAVLEGLDATLVDTAGLRDDAVDETEREGVARAERALLSSDAVVLVVDSVRRPDEADDRARARVMELAASRRRPVVVALSKSDLLDDAAALTGGLAVSAKTGAGLEELSRAVASAAAAACDDEGQTLLLGARDRDAVTSALAEVEAARLCVQEHPSAWEDRAACHLREAHARLGWILGEGAQDEVLRAVFARFCVGK